MKTETNTIKKHYEKPMSRTAEELQLYTVLLTMSGQDKQAQRQGYAPLDWGDEDEE